MAVIGEVIAVNLPADAPLNLSPRARDYVGEVVGVSLGAAGGVILPMCIITGILFFLLSTAVKLSPADHLGRDVVLGDDGRRTCRGGSSGGRKERIHGGLGSLTSWTF